MMNTYTRSRAPFTQSQWQELEHQALIFKYLIAGLPVPPDLLLHIRRSMDPISARLFHYQPMSYGCFQMGFGKKIDREPGRCRRTDGKKWRCSKNSFPDSKYCERHMNRGRNRSRKPVEIISSSSATTLSSTSTPTSTYSSSSFSSSTLLAINQNAYNTNPLHYFHYPQSSSSRPPDFGISPQNSSNHFQLDFGSYTSADKDFRYFYGPKEEVDERIFFSEASGSAKDLFLDNPFRLMPLRMSSSTTQSKPKNLSILQTNNYPQLQTSQDVSKQQHCFLGSDFRSERYIKTEREQQAQPLRHFFDDWPPKTRDSWSDLEDDQSNRASFSTTQLSISIPMASSEFSATNSQSHNDD